MSKVPKSKDKKGESMSIVKGLSLALVHNTRKESNEDITKVIEVLTSKDFINTLVTGPIYRDIPPYLDLVTNNLQSEYCQRLDCSFYTEITKNLITKPLGRFNRDNFNDILKNSYVAIKNYYKIGDSSGRVKEEIKYIISQYFEDQYIKWSDIPAIIIGGIAIIGIIVTLIVFILVIKYRSALVIRRSSPLFLYFMLLGILISFSTVLTFIGMPTNLTCTIRPLILVLAFGLSFLALFVKTFRIKVIFDKSDIKVQDKHLLLYSGATLLLELIIVGIWTFIDKMQPTIINYGPNKHYYTCSNRGSGIYFQWALIIINAIILLYGCYLAIKVRNVYSDYNESKVIGLSIYGIMICMIVQLIISHYSTLGHMVIFIVQSLMIIISSIILLAFMFIPKFWKLQMHGARSASQSKSSQKLPNSNGNNNNKQTLKRCSILMMDTMVKVLKKKKN